MPPEDQNTGNGTPTSSETPSQSQPSVGSSSADNSSTATPEIQHDNTPINPVSEALEAFERELSGGNRPGASAPKPSNLPPSRDFTGLDENEVALFKAMRNDSYAKLYPAYLEYKKIKPDYEKLKPELDQLKEQLTQQKTVPFYEHENAYQLSPEYQTHVANVTRLDTEIAHWEEQLAAAEAGENVQLLEFDPQTRQLFKQAPVPITPGLKAQLYSNLNRAIAIQQREVDKLQSFQNSYKEQHQSFNGQMQQVRQKIFGSVPPEKLQKHAKAKLEMFPPIVRGHLGFQMLAESLVVIDGLVRMVESLRSGQNTQTIKQKTATSAGPTSETVQSGAGSTGTTLGEIREQFRKAKALGYAQ